MKYSLLVLVLIFNVLMCFSRVGAYVGDIEPYSEDGLPKLFNIENYDECFRKNGTFCKVDIVIKAHDKNSKLAKSIERSKKFVNRFERQFLHRLICFPNDTLGDTVRMRQYSLDIAYRELLQHNNFSKNDVEITAKDFHCSGGYPLEFVDYLLWIVCPLYLYLIYKSTTYDLNKRKNPGYPISKCRYNGALLGPRKKQIFVIDEKLYNIFAIRKNWEKVMKNNKSEDFQRLKCIQGLRFYITTMMLINHTKLSYGPLYLKNPKDFEDTIYSHYSYLQVIFDMLLVIQTYFMISSFLMTNQVLEINRKHGYVSLYHCFVLYINRISRFFPSVLVMVLVTMSAPKLFTVGPHVSEFIFSIQKTCRSSWWTPILQLGYLNNFEEMCIPGSWYLSVDTLFYVTGMLIIYFQLKYQLNFNKILTVIFAILSTMFAFTIYVNDYPMIFKIHADIVANLFNSPELNNLYISPLSSYTTMCVGVWFGALYFYTKNQKHQTNSVKQFLWISAMIIFLPLLLILSDLQYEGPIRAIIGSFVKPAFATWAGILIIGLSRKQGGIFNKIFEWNFAVKMANFTFSTYVFHFFLVFQRGAFDTELFEFKNSNLVFVTLFNLVASYVLGACCSLIIEQPFATLQKMYLPQISDPTKPKDTDGVQHNGVEKNHLQKGSKIH